MWGAHSHSGCSKWVKPELWTFRPTYSGLIQGRILSRRSTLLVREFKWSQGEWLSVESRLYSEIWGASQIYEESRNDHRTSTRLLGWLALRFSACEQNNLRPTLSEFFFPIWIHRSMDPSTKTVNRWICVLATKTLENFGREHTVAVKKRCWVQDGLWSDQSCPLPTLTHRLELNDRSLFVISA